MQLTRIPLIALGTAASLTLAACAGPRAITTGDAARTPGMALLTGPDAERRAAARLGFFASDELEGRGTGTRGEKLAARYLAEQLRSFGVEPGGDRMPDGSRSYLNRYRVRTLGFDTSATRLTDPTGKLGPVRMGRDWLSVPVISPTVAQQTVDVVFVGYGISAPEADSYAGLDVKGKLVVVMSGKPAGLDSLKLPTGQTIDPARAQFKLGVAAQKGAAGMVLVGSAGILSAWSTAMPQLAGTMMALAAGPEQPTPPPSPIPLIYANQGFGERLLAALGVPATTGADAPARKPLTSRANTGLRLQMQLTPQRGEVESVNVVGVIPGVGQPEEFVGFGAHFDHNGVVDGQIYNGADDDGSGTIAVLNTAEAFALDRAQGRPTRRSLLFVFHSGEEKGLLGSDHFASNPTDVIPSINAMTAMINMDMVGREAPDSIYTVGASKLSTEFGRWVEEANGSLGVDGRPLFGFNRTYDAPNDPERIYERSDHFNYAKRGVPIVFFTDGMGANWRKGSATDQYHLPTDDVEFIDFGKMARVTRLVYSLGRRTADAPTRPKVDTPAPETGK